MLRHDTLKGRHVLVATALSILLSACAVAGPKTDAEAQETVTVDQTAEVSQGTAAEPADDTAIQAQEAKATDKKKGEDMNYDMTITIGKATFKATLEKDKTASAFAEMLPRVFDMSELNGNEKYQYLDVTLPAAAKNPKRIEAGDIMLYGNNCLVVFYESFDTSYSYTRIGKISDAEGLKDALGTGAAKVRFELK